MKKSKKNTKSERVILLLTPTMKKGLKKEADNAGLSVSSYLITLIGNKERDVSPQAKTSNDEPDWASVCEACKDDLSFVYPNDVHDDPGPHAAYYAYCGNDNCAMYNISLSTIKSNGKNVRI